MRMDNVALAKINSLPSSSMQADFVPTSEQLITLTYGQLQELITQAVEKAIQPLQDEITALRTERDQDRQEIAALRSKLAFVEQQQDTLSTNQLIQLRLFNGLKEEVHKEQPTTITEADRIGRIEKLCQDAPGHTISLSELRGRLGIDKAVLSRLLKKIDREKFYLKKASHDKRVRYLCLRPVVR
jgi:chromosome segregation ATPase